MGFSLLSKYSRRSFAKITNWEEQFCNNSESKLTHTMSITNTDWSVLLTNCLPNAKLTPHPESRNLLKDMFSLLVINPPSMESLFLSNFSGSLTSVCYKDTIAAPKQTVNQESCSNKVVRNFINEQSLFTPAEKLPKMILSVKISNSPKSDIQVSSNSESLGSDVQGILSDMGFSTIQGVENDLKSMPANKQHILDLEFSSTLLSNRRRRDTLDKLLNLLHHRKVLPFASVVSSSLLQKSKDLNAHAEHFLQSYKPPRVMKLKL